MKEWNNCKPFKQTPKGIIEGGGWLKLQRMEEDFDGISKPGHQLWTAHLTARVEVDDCPQDLALGGIICAQFGLVLGGIVCVQFSLLFLWWSWRGAKFLERQWKIYFLCSNGVMILCLQGQLEEHKHLKKRVQGKRSKQDLCIQTYSSAPEAFINCLLCAQSYAFVYFEMQEPFYPINKTVPAAYSHMFYTLKLTKMPGCDFSPSHCP